MASSSPSNSDPELINHSTADVSHHANSTSNDDVPLERPPPLTRQSTSALEKCWICLSTKDEDPPSPPNPPTPWRTPCQCTLQAHEACLLDWIADQEAPRSRGGGRSGPTPDKILCPQCRSEIKVQRSSDLIVQLCRRLDRSYSRLVLPGLVLSVVGTTVAGFYFHGRWSVRMVFGAQASQDLYQTYHGLARHSAYTFIPLNLIFARTRYADFILPSGTLYLLSTQFEQPYSIDWTTWPPLPSTAFALLPLTRQMYNWAYETAFGELNKKWIKEVQPRREEGYEGQEGNIADILNEHEAELAEAEDEGGGGMVLELEVNLGAMQEDEHDHDLHHHHHHHDEALGDMPPVADNADGPQENNANNDARPQAGARAMQLLGDNEFIDDTSSVGQLVLGSLLMPAVAGVCGEALKLILPSSWTTPYSNFYRGRPGLLANKWGRSLVGGLAFVVVKDMLVLYCRWRLAEGHKTRKVMNFDKGKKEYIPV